MLKTILLVIVAIVVLAIAIILILAAFKPDTFSLARSIDVKAPPEKIYPYIADFRKWPEWSPFEKLGPMERTFGGSPQGLGATYGWSGDGKAGSGRMEIVDATSPSRILIKLDFTKPFEAHNLAEFTMIAKGETTTLTWEMRGPLSYFFKIFHTLFNMDNMVGKDFEAGLANLKALAEK